MKLNQITFLVNAIIVFELTNFRASGSRTCVFRNGQRGECVHLRSCRSAIVSLRQGINPTYCNFQLGSVCCGDHADQTEVQPERGRQSQVNRGDFQEQQNGRSGWRDSSDSEQGSNEHEGKNQRSDRTENQSELGRRRNNSNRGRRRGEIENSERTPNDLNIESAINDRPEQSGHSFNRRRSSDEREFVPPGLRKKKPRNNEKNNENNYSNEEVTKKPKRGQGHKNSNKFSNGNHGSHFESNNRPVWGEEDNSGRPVWSTHEEESTTIRRPVWSVNQQEKEPVDPNDWYNNQRPTTKRNKWGQETTTVRNNNGGNSGGFNWPQSYTTESPIPFPQPGSGNTGQGRKRISEIKCEEYSQEVTETISGLPLTANPNPVYISVRKCLQAQQLIVGGANTTIGEFPHMAAVGFRDRNKQSIGWQCGGTLISDLFVLTAAHCASTSLGPPVRVRLGEYNLRKTDDGAHPEDYSISEIITHPEYKPPSKYHDIALLKLSRKVSFNKLIRPACLHLDKKITQTKALATGWGRTFYDGSVSEILQKVVLSIVDKNTCNSLYKLNIRTEVLSRGIIDSQLCAGELSGGKDTCQGDSGGPLSITNTKCIHHIIGITSFGKSCALPNSTGVYTRISSYVPWIESIVWPEE